MAPRKDIECTISSYGNYKKGNVTGSGRNHPFSVIGPMIGQGYTAAYDIPNGQSDFTGSRSGVCGVHVTTHGSAVFHLTGGGTIAASELGEGDDGYIAPLHIKKVTGASSAVITVFKK